MICTVSHINSGVQMRRMRWVYHVARMGLKWN